MSESEIKVDGSSPPSSPVVPPTSESTGDMLRMMMSMMTQQREDNLKVKEELSSLRQDNSLLRSQMESTVRRITRRQSTMLPLAGPATPLPSPPKVSSMTHAAYTHLRTPTASSVAQSTQAGARRQSVGGAVNVDQYDMDGGVDDDAEDEVVDSEDDEKMEAQPIVRGRQRKGRVDEDKEAAKLAKVMSKRAPPAPFTGEKESEKEAVEQWVVDANEYLDSQFGQLAHEYPHERMLLIRSYIKGAAALWITAALQTDPSQTWETLQGPFVEFIRGGRESRSLWLEKMKSLVYGKGKCKDMLQLEQEFEILRVKLYPTSSTDPAMNEIVGREYVEIIRRGDVEIYKEMLRMVGAKDRVTLSEWKTVAVKAAAIVALTRHTGNQGQKQRWGGHNRYEPLAVQCHEMNTEGASEAESQPGPGAAKGEDQSGVEVQQMQGQKAASGGPRRGPFRPRGPYIPEEERKVIIEKGLCWQCYQPGHRIGDAACKEKGKPRRRPTQAELKA
jgi:hypothetical protein